MINITDLQRRIGENLVLFVGAGASITYPSILPSFFQLRNQLLLELFDGLNEFDSYRIDLETKPTKPELLLQIIWEYMQDMVNPIEGFQYATPNINHGLIARLCQRGVRIIITPNFDRGIEKALELLEIQFEVIAGSPMSIEEFHYLSKSLKSIPCKNVLIWKPHGDVLQPNSLCYTIEQVARLNNSKYLKVIYNELFKNYDFLMMGYSGHDDDFFPLLFEYPLKEKVNRKIFWNSYQPVQENTPAYKLKQSWEDNMQIIIGDMEDLLLSLEGNKNFSWDLKPTNKDWIFNLRTEMGKLKLDDKVTIVGKYLFQLYKSEEAEKLWNFGLSLPVKTKENELRFLTNTVHDLENKKKVLEICLSSGQSKTAAITLYNIISYLIHIKNFDVAYKEIRRFKKLHQSQPEYFHLTDYQNLISEYLKIKYRDNYKRVSIFRLKLLKNNMDHFFEKGNIIDFIQTYTKVIGQMATDNTAAKKDFDEIVKYIPLLESYTIHPEMAGLCYAMATLAHQVDTFETASYYLSIAEKELELSYKLGIYNDSKYFALLSLILHERSAYGTASDAIKLTNKAISILDKISDEDAVIQSRTVKEYRGIYLTSLGNNYFIIKKYNKAEEALKLSFLYGSECGNNRGAGRALSGLGDVYLKTRKIKDAIEAYKMALKILTGIGENTSRLEEKLKYALEKQ